MRLACHQLDVFLLPALILERQRELLRRWESPLPLKTSQVVARKEGRYGKTGRALSLFVRDCRANGSAA